MTEDNALILVVAMTADDVAPMLGHHLVPTFES